MELVYAVLDLVCVQLDWHCTVLLLQTALELRQVTLFDNVFFFLAKSFAKQRLQKNESVQHADQAFAAELFQHCAEVDRLTILSAQLLELLDHLRGGSQPGLLTRMVCLAPLSLVGDVGRLEVVEDFAVGPFAEE